MLTLELTGMAGDGIKENAAELCEIATRLRVACKMQFNEVSIIAMPGAYPQYIVHQYGVEMRGGSPVKMVFARPPRIRGGV